MSEITILNIYLHVDWEGNKRNLGNNGNIFPKKDFFPKKFVSNIIFLLDSFIFFHSFSNPILL